MPKYKSGYCWHTGHVRDHNEDSYFVDDALGLWIVADGMGGHNAGEVASRIVTKRLPEAIRQGMSLEEAVRETNRAVFEFAQRGNGRQGMGSTVVALRVHGYDFQVSWVGDSRAYLWSGAVLRQLTRDHSFVQELVDSGWITPEEALVHPQRNLITQAVGLEPEDVKVESISGRLGANDKMLLCSDGLSGEVTDREIAQILNATTSEQHAADQLTDFALKHGGRDNITTVVVSLNPF